MIKGLTVWLCMLTEEGGPQSTQGCQEQDHNVSIKWYFNSVKTYAQVECDAVSSP